MLQIQNISKTFNPGTVNEKKAVAGLSLHLREGDFVTIIGSNGAGKSTLFNAVCGDFYTDSGTILLGGKDITFQPSHVRSKDIGRLFQDPMRGSAPGMTIEDNLYLAAGSGGAFSRSQQVIVFFAKILRHFFFQFAQFFTLRRTAFRVGKNDIHILFQFLSHTRCILSVRFVPRRHRPWNRLHQNG